MTARTGQLREDSRDGTTMAVERGYLGQDFEPRHGNPDGTPCQLREDIWDMTFGTGPLKKLGQDIQDRTVRAGQYRQASLTGSLDR